MMEDKATMNETAVRKNRSLAVVGRTEDLTIVRLARTRAERLDGCSKNLNTECGLTTRYAKIRRVLGDYLYQVKRD